MRKLGVLGLICLFIFAYCNSPADPEIKKALNPEPIILPTINYFTATPLEIVMGNSSILSWSVKDAIRVEIDQGIGVVESEAAIEVSPATTTTYTLTAINNDGKKTASVTVTVVLPRAILKITIIPEVPVFTFVGDSDDNDLNDYYYSSFTIVVAETNGVGGNVEVMLRFLVSTGPFFGAARGFEPFGTVSLDIYVRHYRTEPPYIKADITGVDNNGYSFDISFTIPVILGN